MKTILDRSHAVGKTFLMYGNMDDVYYQPDLVPRNFEQMLVQYLKSRGYRHVIFYGEDGTKGAFCLDKTSAKFFFHENRRGMPMERGEKVSSSSEHGGGGGKLAGMLGRKPGSRYRQEGCSGDRSEPARNKAASGAEAGPVEKRNLPSVKSCRFRYARRSMRLSEFLNMVLPMMLDRESHMAVVFYNIFTTDINQYQALRNCILDVWEKRDMDNCCILLAPGTLYEQESLIQSIQNLNMQSRFLIREDNRYLFNPKTCCRVGFPMEDEVKNLLKRYAVIGTERGGATLKFRYQDLDELAEEIIFASRFCSREESYKELSFENLKEIRARLENWAKEQDPRDRRLRIEDVRPIWGVSAKNKKSALECLNRPGWENVYEAMADLYAVTQKKMEKQETCESNTKPEKESYDWAVNRIGNQAGGGLEGRFVIPNFVLLGNPGTGKTTIARLIGQLLKELGILKRGHTVEVTKKDLTSSFIAGIPQATMACVEAADEGVLFIDEAHALGKKDGGVNNEGTGNDVVSTLCSAMTDPSRHFCVVLAGYEEEMDAVFKLDPGFERRFDKNFIKLEDYRPDVLKKILLNYFLEQGYTVSEELLEEIPDGDKKTTRLDCMLNRLYAERNRRTFGNADVMIRLAQYAMNHCENEVIREDSLYRGEIDHQWFVPANVSDSYEQIMQELRENYVGLDGVCKVLKSIRNRVAEAKKNGKEAIEIVVRSIILVGNPGTGKTTVANMLGRLLFSLGVLGTPKPIILHASQLASRYSGGTQEIVNEKIKEAQEQRALLFVDEAHDLCTGMFDGQGAMNTFMAPLTDKGHPLTVVFAVYPEYLEAFKRLNIGTSRRFQEIELRDYTGEELYQILMLMMKKEGYWADEETKEKLREICEDIYIGRDASTGNAGKMERLLEEMHDKRRERCDEQGIDFGTPEAKLFQMEDIPKVW